MTFNDLPGHGTAIQLTVQHRTQNALNNIKVRMDKAPLWRLIHSLFPDHLPGLPQQRQVSIQPTSRHS